MNLFWYDVLGSIGVACILVTYLMTQLGKMRASSVRFPILNAIGALCVLISLSYEFNMHAFIIEIFWLLISLIGIGRNLHLKRELRQAR